MMTMQDTVDTIEVAVSPGRLSTSSKLKHGNRKSKSNQKKSAAVVNDEGSNSWSNRAGGNGLPCI